MFENIVINKKFMNYQVWLKFQAYKKVSGGGRNPTGGNPVCGSVPLALLNNKIWGSGLWSS